MTSVPAPLEILRSSTGAAFEVVVDASQGIPIVVHWGAPLVGDVSGTGRAGTDPPDPDRVGRDLASAGGVAQVPGGGVTVPISTAPEHAAGSDCRPGLAGHRGGGRDWAPRFVPDRVERRGPGHLAVHARDPIAGLALVTTFELGDALVVRQALTNVGERRYSLDALTVTLPIPDDTDELLTLAGRWTGEFAPRRRPWADGAWTAENRRGRTSHDRPPTVFAGRAGFTEWSGQVRGVHLAWSGNHVLLADRLADGRRYVQAGELLHPGEVVLEPGATYTTPDVVAVWSDRGLTPASWGFHRHLRSLHAPRARPRPISLNTWEASYFDLDEARLRALATAAASIGVERFVLDDGWFGARRDDRRGLGDWEVSTEVFPDGLTPLIDHVRGLGMEFGIWVEPEMVSPDSELARAHPDWIASTSGYEPIEIRHQLVLDLTNPDAYAHVRDQLDRLLSDHEIAAVKWDMNRDHVGVSDARGAASTHAQTLAVYRLFAELTATHPDVEFESCASGGGRIDLGILRWANRVWTSDGNDPVDRQRIQRGASLLVPFEVLGAHVGPRRAHTTGRVQSLAFRIQTAMFGHLGLELDVTTLDERERSTLATSLDVYRSLRPLLHRGDTVRFDLEDPFLAHGVLALDRSDAVVSVAALGSPRVAMTPMLRIADLTPDRRYRIEPIRLPGDRWGLAVAQPAWLDDPDGLVLTGRQLAEHGFRPPVLAPASAAIFRMRAEP